MIRRKNRVVLDSREFANGKLTGIGRVIEGIVDALAESHVFEEIVLPGYDPEALPKRLQNRKRIRVETLPKGFIRSEKALSDFCKKDCQLFISPYPKLPLFGCDCLTVHTVHDVLDVTHPAYKKRLKAYLDKLRLKKALRRADLTWYDSSWSREETEKLTGFSGNNPRVRYLGIDEAFTPKKEENEEHILEYYGLQPGYILILGNGLPHKNLSIILGISDHFERDFVFVGVRSRSQAFWKKDHPKSKALWIEYVENKDLPAIIRGAFCLAQPSTAEGYGFPPLEAMACGVPAVVSNIQVLVETTGAHALGANPKIPGEWVEKLRRLEKEDIYRSQIENGLKWVEPFRGRKGWEKHVSDIEELIEGRKDRVL